MQKETVRTVVVRLLRILSILLFLTAIGLSLRGLSSRWLNDLDRPDLHNRLSEYGEIEPVLSRLQQAYDDRSPDKLDTALDLFSEDRVPMILGTSPGEMMEGRDALGRLLLWDWKHWGDLDFGFENSHIQVDGGLAEIVTFGELRSDRYRFDIPLRVHLVLVEEDESWRIATLSANYAVTVEYFIMSLVLVVLAVALLLVAILLDSILFYRAKPATPDS